MSLAFGEVNHVFSSLILLALFLAWGFILVNPYGCSLFASPQVVQAGPESSDVMACRICS